MIGTVTRCDRLACPWRIDPQHRSHVDLVRVVNIRSNKATLTRGWSPPSTSISTLTSVALIVASCELRDIARTRGKIEELRGNAQARDQNLASVGSILRQNGTRYQRPHAILAGKRVNTLN